MKDVSKMVAQLMAASSPNRSQGRWQGLPGNPSGRGCCGSEENRSGHARLCSRSTNEAYWLRDAANIENSQALVLIGLAKPNLAGYDCGGCGFSTCKEFEQNRQMQEKEMGYTGPHCIMRMMDIGVALSSAAKTASLLNVNNRVQQRVAAAAGPRIHQGGSGHGHTGERRRQSIYFDRPTAAKH